MDHFNSEILGLHVCKVGDRFAALEPVHQAPAAAFAAIEEGCAAGLSLRSDHGSQYVSRDFRAEPDFLGIEHSLAFVREPECKGVAESMVRRLKAQCIRLHRFRDREEARLVIGDFVALHNSSWLVALLQRPGTVRDMGLASVDYAPDVAATDEFHSRDLNGDGAAELVWGTDPPTVQRMDWRAVRRDFE